MATKKPTTRKTTTKKSPAKKPAAKRVSTRKSKALSVRTLASQVGLRREESDFMTFRITRQTVYWLVLGLVTILFTVWIMQLQADIQELYDQIDATTLEASQM